ncbi:CpaE2 pilus assembly protein [Sulfitobacter noctilucae]|uniref:AAA family ATPase n=1 Tax=Sulfitobacter noctilucae TaxID=1342302 RepID=UPI000A4B892A|nr:AAA family ATPase [Sulfitobacter noctilucae]KIN70662.1 CpaE2 pilus assembly protein [Sulfitobacter noctilucae]
MTLSTAASSQSPSMAAYVCTEQGATLARAVAELTASGDGALRGGGLGGAARLSGGAPIAQMLLTEIGNMPLDAACESVTEICRSGADVIVLGDRDDLSTYRALRQAGALEYFAFPISAAEVLQAQRVTPANDPSPIAPPAPKPALSIGVIGSNGGVGASTLAQNLAFLAAAPKGANGRTALIDADLRFGTQAVDLDCDDTPGLQEALAAPDRIDATFLSATMQRVSDNLSFYSHQSHGTQDITAMETALPQLIKPLGNTFDTVVFDLPRSFAAQSTALMAELDALIMVIPAGYAGVNGASRMIARIKAQVPDLRILPVLSELRSDAGLSRKDIAAGIGRDVVAVLPRSDAAMKRAQRAAKPMLTAQPRSPYARALAPLWAQASTKPSAADDKAKRSFFKRLFA